MRILGNNGLGDYRIGCIEGDQQVDLAIELQNNLSLPEKAL